MIGDYNPGKGSFFDEGALEEIIFDSFPEKKEIWRTVESGRLFLYPIYVLEFFQVFVAVVILLHMGGDLFSKFFLNFRIIGNEIDHDFEITGSSLSACKEKSTELIDNIFLCIILPFPIYLVFYQSFDDGSWLKVRILLKFGFSLLYPVMGKFFAPLLV